MKSLVLLVACATVLVGCAQHHQLQTSFDPSEIAWSQGAGSGIIQGQAFVQTKGGQPRTCAGNDILLMPVSKFADERMTAIYGNTSQGYRPAMSGVIKFDSKDEAAYQQAVKRAQCDAQGNFTFEDVPAGEYYVVAQIVWTVGNSFLPEGGVIMRRIKVTEGKPVKVILSP